jgi:TolB protein
MSNDGQILRFLPVNPAVSSCSAMRWWSTGVLLATCAPDGSGTSQLWLVPTTGATPTALTANPPASGDLGDLDAWRLPAGTYVQDAGACGYIYLAELAPDGLTSPVTVPGADGDSTIVLGAQGNRLEIDAESPCSAGASLLWYAPATNSVTPLLGGTANGGTAENPVMFGQR